MKQIIHSLLIVFALVVSAGHSRAQTPIEFNDQLSSITDSLYKRGQEWGIKFNKACESKDFAALSAPRKDLESFLEANIARLKAMKDVKNSRALRMAMINFLEFERKMTLKAFRPIESLPSSATADEVKAALDRLTAYSAEEKGELNKVASAQGAYAADNGFSVESENKEELHKQ